MVQWLRLCTSTAGGLIPGWGTKILHAAAYGQNFFFFKCSLCAKALCFTYNSICKRILCVPCYFFHFIEKETEAWRG